MSDDESVIRDVSDTALWVAVYRARETVRPEALFRDPLARRLAGARGQKMFDAMPPEEQNEWAFVTRTYLFDLFIAQQIRNGADAVINLAAGLDARPYRMNLPAELKWFEVDFDGILTYKEAILKDQMAACPVERIRLDLENVEARRNLFGRLGSQYKRALILSEGLLAYMTDDEVASLARDLSSSRGFAHWVLDIASPGLLKMLQDQVGRRMLDRADAPLKFGPAKGPDFFTPCGWRPRDVRSVLKTAAGKNRVNWWMRLLALIPESKGRQGSRPWSGVCLFERTPA